jgi:asparagine synthase (glutamine-hydrolysing)
MTFAREANDITKHFDISRWNICLNYGLRPQAPEFLRWAWRFLHGRPQSGWKVEKTINPVFARRIGLAQRLQALEGSDSAPTRTPREQHWDDLTSGLLQYVVELLDKAAAVSSLEVRYPFFDRRFMEFCLALPLEQKLQQGWTRVVMRRAMTNILPPKVQWRTSKGYLGSHFRRRLLEDEREALDEVIVNNPQFLEAYVDVSALRAAYHRYAAEPMRVPENDVMAVFFAFTLASWLHKSNLTP